VEFSIKSIRLEKERGTIIAGVFEEGKFTASAHLLDKASGGHLGRLARRGDLTGKSGSVTTLFDTPGLACERLLLVGLGKEKDLRPETRGAALATALRALRTTRAREAVCALLDSPPERDDPVQRLRQAAIAAQDATYAFEEYKREKTRPAALKKLVFPMDDPPAAAKRALAEGAAIAEGIALARDLGNQPGNVCTPDYLARAAERLAKTHALRLEVLERKDMEKLGMGALLAVAQGSRQPPKLIVLRHKGGRSGAPPIVLVGKGITFDSGGISLKPAAEMDEMKYDMCGAAAVLGTTLVAARLGLPLNLVALAPACENMPDGGATRPGDIVTSLSGQTIEILNTDAEGRLILCDTLAYAERFAPETVIDVATLTGACKIALGHVATGLFTDVDTLARELAAAGEAALDKVWRLPLWEEYQESLKSPFADMTNTGGRPAGAVTAACFLSRFTRKYAWAHLDIAGTAWKSGSQKGATGRPVALLAHFLLARAAREGYGA
jgi:leucyl aminopeptidase